MKKLTRILCLALCLIMLLPSIVACGEVDLSSGAQINMYLTSEVYNFDPAYAHLDSSAVKLLSLMYEGIMKLDDNGKVKKALCDTWEYVEDEGIDEESDEDNTYTMTITLKDSGWTDGRAVHADQFVYAWKRLLEPDFDGEGAELLYDIKGAWERKNMGLSPDDIGLYADQKVLTIEFKHSIDPDDFLRKLTSIALVPLRQDKVDYYHDWSSASTTIVTNGPFSLVSYYPGQSMELGRNTYYRHDVSDEDKEPNPLKYVKPYRILIDFTLNAEEMMQQFENGELFYISELPASKEIREQYMDRVKLSDSLCSHVYYFNTTKAPFDNPTVRKVLSSVISRSEIVSEVVYATASTGFVPPNINDLTSRDDFAENNANKISADAMSIEEARNLLSQAGVNPADCEPFELTVRVNTYSTLNESTGSLDIYDPSMGGDNVYNTVDYVVAQMVIEKWRELGFDCSIKAVNTARYNERTSSLQQFRDTMVESVYGTHGDVTYVESTEEDGTINYATFNVERASFDVIALDYQLLDTTAFSALSVFAADYSGATLDENFQTYGHITGYNNEAYNTLIAEADAARIAGDTETLSAKLHEAEALLLEECPVMPIFVYQNVRLVSSSLSRYEETGWGAPIFDKVNLKNWRDHLPNSDETA